MSRFLKYLLCSAAAFCLFQPLTAGAADATVYSPGQAITDSEKSEYSSILNETAEAIDMNILVVIASDTYTEGAGRDTLEVTYEQKYGTQDGIGLYLDAREENPMHYIMTRGCASQYYMHIPEDRISTIFDEMESFLYPPLDASGAMNIFKINLEYYYEIGTAGDGNNPDVSSWYFYQDDVLQFCPMDADGEMITFPESTEEPEETEPEESEPESEEPVKAETGNGGAVSLYDESSWLSRDEYNQCMVYLKDAAEQTGMNVGMVLGSQVRSDYTIQSLADASYDELFGHGTDGLLYYMDLSGQSSPYDYISTSGMGQMYYTNASDNNRIDRIFDNVFPYLKPAGSEDVVGAIKAFSEEVIWYYEMGVPDRYYVYDDVYDEYYYVKDGALATSKSRPYIRQEAVGSGIFVGFVVGLIAALVTFFVIKSHYKFKSALAPTAYINRRTLEFHQQYDRFVRQYTTKVRVESSSGGRSGGGGGGGGSSSGGHGGGGRHR